MVLLPQLKYFTKMFSRKTLRQWDCKRQSFHRSHPSPSPIENLIEIWPINLTDFKLMLCRIIKTQNPFKHLGWSFLRKEWTALAVNYFHKKLHPRYLTGYLTDIWMHIWNPILHLAYLFIINLDKFHVADYRWIPSNFLKIIISALKGVIIEAVIQRCSVKKVFLENSQNSQENTCGRVSFLIKFSSEFYEISKNNFFTEHLRTTASKIRNGSLGNLIEIGFTQKFLKWN